MSTKDTGEAPVPRASDPFTDQAKITVTWRADQLTPEEQVRLSASVPSLPSGFGGLSGRFTDTLVRAALSRAASAGCPPAWRSATDAPQDLSFRYGSGRTVYLAGPMTGYPNYNFPAFHAAAALLRAEGYEVINPAEGFSGDQSLQWADYMRADVGHLLAVQTVVVLPGWEESKGATLEVTIATALGLGVHTIDGDPVILRLDRKAPGTLRLRQLSMLDLFREQHPEAAAQAPTTRAEPVPDPAPPHDETILAEAERLVSGDRNRAYGHPIEDHARTGIMWGALLGLDEPVKAETVAMMMICLKLSRMVYSDRRDNIVDIAGYARCIERMWRRREGKE